MSVVVQVDGLEGLRDRQASRHRRRETVRRVRSPYHEDECLLLSPCRDHALVRAAPSHSVSSTKRRMSELESHSLPRDAEKPMRAQWREGCASQTPEVWTAVPKPTDTPHRPATGHVTRAGSLARTTHPGPTPILSPGAHAPVGTTNHADVAARFREPEPERHVIDEKPDRYFRYRQSSVA